MDELKGLYQQIDDLNRSDMELFFRKEGLRVLDKISDGVYVIDDQGYFVYMNKAERERSGSFSRKLEGLHYLSILRTEEHKRHRDNFEKVIGGAHIPPHEVKYIAEKGYLQTVEITSSPIYDKGKVIGLLGISRDVSNRKRAEEELRRANDELEQRIDQRTRELLNANDIIGEEIQERKRAEKALGKSEELYRLLVETMNDGVAVIKEDDSFTYINNRFCEMIGYSRDEIIGRQPMEFLDEHNRKIFKKQIAARKKGRQTPCQIAWTRKKGEKIYTNVSPKPIFDEGGSYKGILAAVTDISKIKKAEEVLREAAVGQRRLSTLLITAQEKERRRISLELHDGLGQNLMLLKFKLRSIQRDITGDQTALREGLNQSLQYLGEIIEDVRRLAHDLSPHILENLGLQAALQWLVDEFATHHDAVYSVELEHVANLLSSEEQNTIFRIIQEALTNIVRHARATHVSLNIKKEDGTVSVVVKDDGGGFDMRRIMAPAARGKGLGLATMKERARMLGGSFDISSQEGVGTRITLRMPIGNGGNSIGRV